MQQAIGTVFGQRQAVPIACCFLMSWHSWHSILRWEIAISSTLPFSAVPVLCLFASVESARPKRVRRDQLEQKLAILDIACGNMRSTTTHELGAANQAFFSVFAPSFRALFGFPFWFARQPKRYMDLWRSAQASQAGQHRQIPDEKPVGFLPCARIPGQAHLPEMTRLRSRCRYLTPDLDDVTTTNVNPAITSVVVLPRPFRYTFLRESRLLEEKYQWQKFRITSCRRRSIGTTRPGLVLVPIEATRKLRTPVLDFPEGELYSFQKQKTRQMVW